LYEKIELKENYKTFIGMKTPHFIFENKFTYKELEDERNTLTTVRYTIHTMRDFEIINTEIDESMKNSILDFS